MARTYKSVGYTTRHFEQFAWLLAVLQSNNQLDKPTVEFIKKELTAMFRNENSKFKTEKFLNAVQTRTEQLKNGRTYNL